MSNLWLPPDVERSQAIDEGASQIAEAKRVTAALKETDPYLELVFIAERAPAFPGIEPGRWHVRRSQEGFQDNYWPITGPDGEYVAPSMKVVEAMKAADLWRQGALQDLRDRMDRAQRDREKASELEAEQRKDEIRATWRAAKRVAGDGGLSRQKWGKGR